jgi:N-acetylglucosamine kinase-like BadF-type ATPase
VSALLAVDGGQSGLRMAVVEDGRPARVAEAAGFSHGSGDDAHAIAAAVSAAREALELSEPVARVCLGLTGAPATPELRARLAALISSRLDGAQVALGADMVTAHAGALGGEPGVVVAAGTGAVVLGIGADGGAHRADGLGFLLGDDGSGFAIGRGAVRAALRARESRGPATALEDAADAHFGGLAGIAHRIYASPAPVSDIAAFAPVVARVARAGDEVALGLWADAARRLVDTTAAVLRRTGERVAVSHSGRLFSERDLLLAPFLEGLAERCPSAAYRPPRGDSLAGAARLVHGGLGRYAPLMHSTEGPRT